MNTLARPSWEIKITRPRSPRAIEKYFLNFLTISAVSHHFSWCMKGFQQKNETKSIYIIEVEREGGLTVRLLEFPTPRSPCLSALESRNACELNQVSGIVWSDYWRILGRLLYLLVFSWKPKFHDGDVQFEQISNSGTTYFPQTNLSTLFALLQNVQHHSVMLTEFDESFLELHRIICLCLFKH